MNPEGRKIYHAAELFHLPARVFNDKLVGDLEKNGLIVFSPQKDGFEFTRLISTLQNILSPQLLDNAMQTIIYVYDVSSISKSDVVVARFDEPPDPGVDTEVLIANALGIPVVAYRTDVRSPYGASSDKYRGMHSFPVKTSAVLIMQESSLSPQEDLTRLTERIVHEVKNLPKRKNQETPEFLKKAFKMADLLFAGIGDIHSSEGLKELGRRCLKHKDQLVYFGPRALHV